MLAYHRTFEDSGGGTASIEDFGGDGDTSSSNPQSEGASVQTESIGLAPGAIPS